MNFSDADGSPNGAGRPEGGTTVNAAEATSTRVLEATMNFAAPSRVR
jgi:hypothetical protein